MTENVYKRRVRWAMLLARTRDRLKTTKSAYSALAGKPGRVYNLGDPGWDWTVILKRIVKKEVMMEVKRFSRRTLLHGVNCLILFTSTGRFS
jgi:hypothetical protein